MVAYIHITYLVLHIYTIVTCVTSYNDNVTSQDGGRSYSEEFLLNYPLLYKLGKESYLENDWDNCVTYMNDALLKYKQYQTIKANCRNKCSDDPNLNINTLIKNDYELEFYERILKRSLCIQNCLSSATGQTELITDAETDDEMKSLKPYDYLQLCYHSINLDEMAASSAYSYLIKHPDNDVMLSNLRYYSEIPQVKNENIVNLESKAYVENYILGKIFRSIYLCF